MAIPRLPAPAASAHIPLGPPYGTSSSSGVFSNDLLAKSEYPDLSTGAASTAAANDETYTYNALGQRTRLLDRNGTTHVYTYDVLGRLRSDVVPPATWAPASPARL